jgi:hypothetical protein
MDNDLGTFAVFILTHGRANNVKTIRTLKSHGYTGQVVLVVDDEDKQGADYRRNFPGMVEMFSKAEIRKRIDTFDNIPNNLTILHPRNACFDIAERLGIRTFVQLDDDYMSFMSRYAEDGKLKGQKVKDLDSIFAAVTRFFWSTSVSSIAIAQGGDFIGGLKSGTVYKSPIYRKAMNSFFCSPERRFSFVSRMNEDVSTYTTLGSRGHLFMTTFAVMLTQAQTQSQKGGLTEMYLQHGTYAKSFYTVMTMPSSVKVGAMSGTAHPRIHHSIDWDTTVPKIVRQIHQKQA